MARVLVVEDNADNRELMTYLLTAFGHEVATANDGEAALSILESVAVDLVVCDVHLPKMDGCEVVQVMKGQPRLSAIPVVAVTALAMVGDRDRVMAAGFDGYVAKPIEPRDFVGEVEAFLPQGSSPARPEPARTMQSAPAARTRAASFVPRARLLVVDDVHENREFTLAVLEPSGYEVTLSSNAEQALATVAEQRFDLILCDLRMPGKDGLDLLAALKSNPRFAPIPFLIVTASKWAERERRRALELGALRFLQRPLEPSELLNEVETCLESAEAR